MAESFSIVRKTNPEGIIFSNVGADVPVDKAVKAVELLDAQALQVHVNAPQKLVMPEGMRVFDMVRKCGSNCSTRECTCYH